MTTHAGYIIQYEEENSLSLTNCRGKNNVYVIFYSTEHVRGSRCVERENVLLKYEACSSLDATMLRRVRTWRLPMFHNSIFDYAKYNNIYQYIIVYSTTQNIAIVYLTTQNTPIYIIEGEIRSCELSTSSLSLNRI